MQLELLLELLATDVSHQTQSLLDRDVCGEFEQARNTRANPIGVTMEALFGVAGPSQIETFNHAIMNLNQTVSEQIKFNL